MPQVRHPISMPAIVARHGRSSVLTQDGELLELPAGEAVALLAEMPPPLLIHRAATARRLGIAGMDGLDLLELFALVLPARSAAPTSRGLALALGLEADL